MPRSWNCIIIFMMPFIVVQTIEKGELKLTAVPDTWQKNGILFWPKNKQERLRRQEECVPDHTWTPINCIIKRSNLSTFEEAEAEIDGMSDKSDTEADNEYLKTKRPSRSNKKELSCPSFNKMAEELSENHKQSAIMPSAITQEESAKTRGISSFSSVNKIQSHQTQQSASNSSVLQQNIIITEADYFPEPFESQDQNVVTSAQPLLTTTDTCNVQNVYNDQNYVILSEQALEDIKVVKEDIKVVKEDVKTVLYNQNALCELQNSLLFKLSEFQTQFEGYIKLTSKSQQSQDSTIKPIKNLHDLEDFEKTILDGSAKEQLRRKLCVVCSKGPGKGTSNAYYLIDSMFDRSFFKNCSWTGTSKGETPKICFKGFTKSIQFFFDIVHETDTSFTKAECDKFFKIILKNARQRCDSNQRMSTSKQRTKGKKTRNNPLAISSAVNEPIDPQQSPHVQPLAAHEPKIPQPSSRVQPLAAHETTNP